MVSLVWMARWSQEWDWAEWIGIPQIPHFEAYCSSSIRGNLGHFGISHFQLRASTQADLIFKEELDSSVAFYQCLFHCFSMHFVWVPTFGHRRHHLSIVQLPLLDPLISSSFHFARSGHSHRWHSWHSWHSWPEPGGWHLSGEKVMPRNISKPWWDWRND